MFITLDFHLELLASVHGKTINHDLTKQAMVGVSFPCRLKLSESVALSEIAIGDAAAGIQYQTYGYNKDG